VAVNGTTVSGIAERFATDADAVTRTWTALASFALLTTSGADGKVTRFTPSGSSNAGGYPVTEGDTISVTSDGQVATAQCPPV